MSKYTTEVRFICENKSGLSNSVGANDVDNVIDKSWNKIFTSNVALFDEEYRSIICKKILKHYYLREIGTETVGVWLLWMNTRFEEIMPYYNQLYESTKIKFEPLNDVNITRKHDRNNESDSTNNTIGNSLSKDLYSDTPQGAITGIDNENYLTDARKITSETNSTDNIKASSTEDYLEIVTGKQGGNSYSKMLNEYRETFLNIDKMVIEEFNDLFFGLW